MHRGLRRVVLPWTGAVCGELFREESGSLSDVHKSVDISSAKKRRHMIRSIASESLTSDQFHWRIRCCHSGSGHAKEMIRATESLPAAAVISSSADEETPIGNIARTVPIRPLRNSVVGKKFNQGSLRENVKH